jgi:integrase/recombinase XerD
MGVKRKIKKSAGSDEVYLLDAFEEFIIEKEVRNLAPATIKNYELTFRLFCEFNEFDNDTLTTEVELSNVYKWINTMKQEDVKISSINHYLRDLGVILHWYMDVDRGYIKPFKMPKLESQEEQPKLFSDEELELLLEKPRRNGTFVEWRTYTIVNWVLGTGNRASTICDVKINDINFSKREITLGHTKNKKAQIIPLSSSLETVLKEYIKMWRREADTDGWLFPNVGEEKLTTNALRLSFATYCRNRGVERTNIHGLRHNFAKGWVRNNGNQFALQKILGHSKLTMTSKYVKLYSEDIKDDFDRFNPLDTIKRSSRRTQTVKKNLD